mmetsp:Transcript_43789/g.103500  ORF Transcript_43789/g.103500 Transcript_43789/m.103500 type:complete len:366 (+) Transcript_43789:122-1219(+)
MGCGSSVNHKYEAGLADVAVDQPLAATVVAASSSTAAPPPADDAPMQPDDGMAMTRKSTTPAEVPKLSMLDFQAEQVLDQTSRSTVLCLRGKRDGRLFACKLTDEGRRGNAAHEDWCNEVALLHKFAGSGHVVTLHGVAASEEGQYSILVELCSGGSLTAWLTRYPRRARQASLALLDAVQYIHSQFVCHLDLHPGSFVIDDTGMGKLCDFACAKQLASIEDFVTSVIVTPEFAAPEVSPDQAFQGIRADVFSLGKTLQAARAFDPSWRDGTATLGRMVSKDPTARPGIAQVRQDAFGGGKVPDIVSQHEKALFELQDMLSFEPWRHQESSDGGVKAVTAATGKRTQVPPPSEKPRAAHGIYEPL